MFSLKIWPQTVCPGVSAQPSSTRTPAVGRWSRHKVHRDAFLSEPGCSGVKGRNQKGLPALLPTSRNVPFCSAGKEKGFLPATLKCPQPTNPEPGTASTTSVQNKQLAAPHHMQATKQSIHTNRMVKKCSSPEANANMTFSSQKLECLATNLLHHDPQNRIQKTNRNMAAIKGPRLDSKGLISSSIYGLTPTRQC